MVNFVNLTPHTLNVWEGDAETIIPVSGTVARVVFEDLGTTQIGGITVQLSPSIGQVVDLPAPQDGVFYIVSAIVAANEPNRRDLLSPGNLRRNDDGQPIGCDGFKQLAKGLPPVTELVLGTRWDDCFSFPARPSDGAYSYSYSREAHWDAETGALVIFRHDDLTSSEVSSLTTVSRDTVIRLVSRDYLRVTADGVSRWLKIDGGRDYTEEEIISFLRDEIGVGVQCAIWGWHFTT